MRQSASYVDDDGDDGYDSGEDGGASYGGPLGGARRVPGSSGPEDPLVVLDLGQHLGGLFTRLGVQQAALLMAAGAEMSARQAKAVKALFGAPAG